MRLVLFTDSIVYSFYCAEISSLHWILSFHLFFSTFDQNYCKQQLHDDQQDELLNN